MSSSRDFPSCGLKSSKPCVRNDLQIRQRNKLTYELNQGDADTKSPHISLQNNIKTSPPWLLCVTERQCIHLKTTHTLNAYILISRSSRRTLLRSFSNGISSMVSPFVTEHINNPLTSIVQVRFVPCSNKKQPMQSTWTRSSARDQMPLYHGYTTWVKQVMGQQHLRCLRMLRTPQTSRENTYVSSAINRFFCSSL